MFPKAYVLAGFLQDDWRVRNNLTLNLGLRYDVEIIKDIPDWPAPTDKNNLDPRVGFAWDPKGDQKWSVRGGFGRFTQQYAIFTIVKGGVGGRNGQVTVSLAPTDPLFPTFPNALPAFPPGAVLPPRDIQEISPDLENEHAWTGEPRLPAPARPAHEPSQVDANINRGVKHGFLDMNQAAPIPKDVLNAALASNPNATIRTQAQADATRPIRPVPNGFRRMDLLTNEGRSWYQGVRIAAQHRTDAARADGVLHALEVRGSAEPLVLARKQRRSRARSRADRRRHAAQPRHQRDVERPRQRSGPERMAPERRLAPSEREPLHDPLRGRPDGRWIDRRLQQPRLPVEPARRAQHGARQVHQLRGPDAGPNLRGRDPTGSRFAPTCSTCSTTRTSLAGGYIGLVGNPQVRPAHGRSQRLPRPAVPVRDHVSVLSRCRIVSRSDFRRSVTVRLSL